MLSDFENNEYSYFESDATKVINKLIKMRLKAPLESKQREEIGRAIHPEYYK